MPLTCTQVQPVTRVAAQSPLCLLFLSISVALLHFLGLQFKKQMQKFQMYENIKNAPDFSFITVSVSTWQQTKLLTYVLYFYSSLYVGDALCIFQFPESGFYGLQDKILLFRHDQADSNVLKLITSEAEVKEGTLVELVLSGT